MFPEREVPRGFRRATPADLPALVRLEAATFELHRIDRRHFRRLLRSPSVVCQVVAPLEEQGAAAVWGYGLVFLRRGKSRARLYSLAVDPTRRGQGIGGDMVRYLMSTLPSLGQTRLSLEVRADDDGAIRFYERLGFRMMQRLVGYYDDGAEALRLVVDLPRAAGLKPAPTGHDALHTAPRAADSAAPGTRRRAAAPLVARSM